MYCFDWFVRFQITACVSTRLDRTLLAEGVRISAPWSQNRSVGEMSTFKAKPPAGTDPIGASSEGASLYELIREDIIEGRLAANERPPAPPSPPRPRHP